MSLQSNNILNQFVTNCTSLWTSWNTGAPGSRQTRIQQAVAQMTSFMVRPSVAFTAMSGWGSFNWGGWRLKLSSKYTGQNDIKYGKFLEFCSTIYHETRHAEQFYRIA